jgi:hypothetical protein
MSASDSSTGEAGWETAEQFLARLAANRAKRKAAAEAAKPRIVATVSPKVAEAIKHDPESLRVSVSANGADGAVAFDRPRRVEVLEVLEVDACGRPSKVARFECATGERSVIEFEGGYRQPSVVAHVYDPLDALKGDRE